MVVDRKNWRSVDHVPLGYFGAVHDVRIIDVPDLAHHGVPLLGVDRLGSESLLARIRSHRLEANEGAYHSRALWGDFEMAMGDAATNGDGWRRARALGLALLPVGAYPRQWGFDFVLEQMPGGHVDVVMNYEGRGGDTKMEAFILQASRQGSVLSLWHHKGAGWSAAEPVIARGLPMSGRCVVTAESGRLTISIDDQLVVDRDWDIEQKPNSRTGIRWLGASVRPSTAET